MGTPAWPYWRDTRDGERYELVSFATGPCPVKHDALTTFYVLKHRFGGLNVVSPAPGLPGCTIEQDFDRDGPTKRDEIAAMAEDSALLFLTEPQFDEAIVGLAYHESRVVYDQDTIIGVLMDEMGMKHEEAVEHFDSNIAGSRGGGSPLYIQRPL